MSLYRVDIKKGSEKKIFSILDKNGFEVISSEVLSKDGDESSFRFEVMAPQKSFLHPHDVLTRELGTSDFEIKEHQGIFEKSGFAVSIAEGINNNRILDYTSNKVLHSLKNNGLNSLERIRNIPFLKNRMGLISDGKAYDLSQSTLLDLKRDAVILAKFADINGVPIMIHTKNEDEFIRNAIALSENFYALRVSGIQCNFDTEEFSRISSSVHIPVIFHDTMERAPAIAAVVANALTRMKSSAKDKKAAIIGMSTVSEILVTLLKNLGIEKVYGIDSNPALLSRFERGEGIVATLDQVYENADVIVVMPGVKTILDEKRFHDGQLIISFASGCMNLSNLAAEIMKYSFFGHEPNPFYTLPGIATYIRQTENKEFNQNFIRRVMESLLLNDNETGLLPRPNKAFIKKQAQYLIQ